jgi:hypothetical protein
MVIELSKECIIFGFAQEMNNSQNMLQAYMQFLRHNICMRKILVCFMKVRLKKDKHMSLPVMSYQDTFPKYAKLRKNFNFL